jgi:2-dehydropantoate 2-reductase
MGGSLAAEARAAGHDVTVVDVNRALADHVNAHGLTVDTPQGTVTADVRAVTEPGEAPGADVVVVFVKAQHTESAARALAPALGPGTVVVTLQNGWGNADVLARHLPVERLVMGVTYNSCTAGGLGHCAHTGQGATFVGPHTPGGDLEPARRAAEFLTSAGWGAEATGEVRTEIWKKLVLNAATLPTAALTLLPAGDLGRPGPMLDLVDGLTREAVAVAAAQGLDIDAAERTATIHAVLDRAGRGKASMLQDVEARRKTEIEVVNAAVVRAGEQHGVDAPLNRAMVALVGGLERSWSL